MCTCLLLYNFFPHLALSRKVSVSKVSYKVQCIYCFKKIVEVAVAGHFLHLLGHRAHRKPRKSPKLAAIKFWQGAAVHACIFPRSNALPEYCSSHTRLFGSQTTGQLPTSSTFRDIGLSFFLQSTLVARKSVRVEDFRSQLIVSRRGKGLGLIDMGMWR